MSSVPHNRAMNPTTEPEVKTSPGPEAIHPDQSPPELVKNRLPLKITGIIRTSPAYLTNLVRYHIIWTLTIFRE